jgi:hypothetical protein
MVRKQQKEASYLAGADRKAVRVKVASDLIDVIDAHRRSLSLSRTAFINLAIAAYVRRWKSPVDSPTVEQEQGTVSLYETSWPKSEPCPIDGKMHDPYIQEGHRVTEQQ